MMRQLLLAVAATGILASPVWAGAWEDKLAAARGQTVYWNAWGGDERTNDFIAWVGERTAEKYGVRIAQVKLSDTSEAVTRVAAEKGAGLTSGGSVDLIWINGPNFLSMKEKGLLRGPFLSGLPNARFLDSQAGSANVTDFTIPTDGYESPWRLARFVLQYDAARVSAPPPTLAALVDWARANPGRMTHPIASNFMGSTFLKQALVELVADRRVLAAPATDANFDATVAPLWAWYDNLRPNLWRQGRVFPAGEADLQRLLNDGELDLGMSFDPASAAAAIDDGLLPATIRTYAPRAGSIGNVSFVAIPFNASNWQGAEVVANELLDPAVQAYAQNITMLGSFSVLDPARLDAAGAASFADLPRSPALPDLAALGPALPEPHPSWMTRIAAAWEERYVR